MFFRRQRFPSPKSNPFPTGKKAGTLRLALVTACSASLFQIAAPAAPLDRSLSVQMQSQREAAQSQARIEKLADQTEELATRYKNAVAELDNLRVYDDQVEKLVDAQQRESASIGQQLRDIDVTEKQIQPLVQRMFAALDDVVKQDVPFLEDERRARLRTLSAMLDDPAVPTAEKFRAVMAAYRLEMAYGGSISAYRGQVEENGTLRAADFLRIGRIALLYRTLDGKDSGYWNQQQRRWIAGGEKYSRTVAAGIRIARNEAAPDLIDAPVAASRDHD
jgi:hypothetical protein